MQKIKNFVTTNLKNLLVLLLVVGTALLIYITLSRQPEEEASPFSKVNTNEAQTGYFRVTEVFPEESEIETWDITIPIMIYFSKSIDENNIKVEVSPDTLITIIKIKEDDNFVRIIPRDGWHSNVAYTITIKEALSINGEVLETPYVHSFKIIKTPNPAVY